MVRGPRQPWACQVQAPSTSSPWRRRSVAQSCLLSCLGLSAAWPGAGHVERLLPERERSASTKATVVRGLHSGSGREAQVRELPHLETGTHNFGFFRAAQAALSRSAGKASSEGAPLWLALAAACDPYQDPRCYGKIRAEHWATGAVCRSS